MDNQAQTGSGPSIDPTVPMGGMGRSRDEGQYTTPLQITIPHVFHELLHAYRYKVLYGGRGGAKSFGVADTLLVLGMQKKLRVLCARELQVSINDSVHKLLSDEIARYGLSSFYMVQQATIKGANGTEFLFKGLRHNANEIKSTEGVDICWVEEAQKVSDNSWELLIPTIRKDGSEIWMTFNPSRPDDATYKRFVVSPPEGSLVRKVSWRDNPFFPDVLDKERLHLMKTDKEAYDHIWEGEFDTRFFGGVYSKQIEKLRELGQITDRVDYDSKFPVYTAWDLGWTDATAIWFFQVGMGEIFVIDYWEGNGKDVKSCMEVLCGREIVVSHIDPLTKREQWNFGGMSEGNEHRKDWIYAKHSVPHDAMNKVQAAGGRSIVEQASNFGVKMDMFPATSTMNGIQALRMTLPRCWINSTRCKDLLEAMTAYHFEYDEDKLKFKDTPYHDWSSHCAKAGELMARVWREKALTILDMARTHRETTWKRLRSEAKMDNKDPYRTKKPLKRK